MTGDSARGRHGYPKHPFPSDVSDSVRKNIELNDRELELQKTVLASKPVIAWVAFTGKCNLACSHCSRTPEMIGMGEEMIPALFDKLCSQLFPFVERIWIGGNNGGEQLLAKHWDSRIMEHLSRFSLIPDLLTNGTLLSEKRIEQLVSGHATIRVSLEGVRPETYHSSRKKDIDDLLHALSKVSEARRRRENNRTRIHIAFTCYYDNVCELPDLVCKAHEMGVDRVEVHHLFPLRESQRYQSLVYHRSLSNSMFDEAERLAAELDVELFLPRRFDMSSMDQAGESPRAGHRKPCPLPWIATSVNEHGIVRPCCASSMKMGDLNVADLDEIWNGRAYQTLRKTVNSPSPLPDCARCTAAWGGLNYKDESILRSIGLSYAKEMSLAALAKQRIQRTVSQRRIGRRALEAYKALKESANR